MKWRPLFAVWSVLNPREQRLVNLVMDMESCEFTFIRDQRRDDVGGPILLVNIISSL